MSEAFSAFCAAAAAHEEPRPRLLTVSGEAEIEVAPDRADVSFSAEASEKTLADAEKAVTEATARLLKLCDSLGIEKNRVRSAQLNVHPQYDGGIVSNRPRIVGYGVSRQVDVDLRDLSKLGKLLQDTVDYESRAMLKRLNVMTREDVKVLSTRLSTLSKKIDEYAARREAVSEAPLAIVKTRTATGTPKAARPRQPKTTKR